MHSWWVNKGEDVYMNEGEEGVHVGEWGEEGIHAQYDSLISTYGISQIPTYLISMFFKCGVLLFWNYGLK